MNSDLPQTPREEMEARITSLILGELSGAEADATRRAIEHDTELARLYERLKQTIDLVREATANPLPQTGAQPEALRLSAERRQQLLERFKTVAPKEFAASPRREMAWYVPMSIAAGLVFIIGSAALVPGFWKSAVSPVKLLSRAYPYGETAEQRETKTPTDVRFWRSGRSSAREADRKDSEQQATVISKLGAGSVVTALPYANAAQPQSAERSASGGAREVITRTVNEKGAFTQSAGRNDSGNVTRTLSASTPPPASTRNSIVLPSANEPSVESAASAAPKPASDSSQILSFGVSGSSGVNRGFDGGIGGGAGGFGGGGGGLGGGGIGGGIRSNEGGRMAFPRTDAASKNIADNSPPPATPPPDVMFQDTDGLIFRDNNRFVGRWIAPTTTVPLKSGAVESEVRLRELNDASKIAGVAAASRPSDNGRKENKELAQLGFDAQPATPTTDVLRDENIIAGTVLNRSPFALKQSPGNTSAPVGTPGSVAEIPPTALEERKTGQTLQTDLATINSRNEFLPTTAPEPNSVSNRNNEAAQSQSAGAGVVAGGIVNAAPSQNDFSSLRLDDAEGLRLKEETARANSISKDALALGDTPEKGNLFSATPEIKNVTRSYQPTTPTPTDSPQTQTARPLEPKANPADSTFGKPAIGFQGGTAPSQSSITVQGFPGNSTLAIPNGALSGLQGNPIEPTTQSDSLFANQANDGLHAWFMNGISANSTGTPVAPTKPAATPEAGKNVELDLGRAGGISDGHGAGAVGAIDPKLMARYGLIRPTQPQADKESAGITKLAKEPDGNRVADLFAKAKSEEQPKGADSDSDRLATTALPERNSPPTFRMEPQMMSRYGLKPNAGSVSANAVPPPDGPVAANQPGSGLNGNPQTVPEILGETFDSKSKLRQSEMSDRSRKLAELEDESKPRQQAANAPTISSISNQSVTAAPVDAKRELERLQNERETITRRIQQEKIDPALPRNSGPVEIVEPAQAQTAQNSTLWQRLSKKLGGEVESTARLKIEKDNSDLAPLLMGVPSQNAFDPYFVQTEFEKIKSKAVLYQVIDKLKLDETWAKDPGGNGKLSRAEAYKRLADRINVHADRNTNFVDIQVKSDKPEEAARIANTIAEVYRDTRAEAAKRFEQLSVQKLNEVLVENEKSIENAKERLARQTPLPNNEPGAQLKRTPAPTAPVPQPEITASENPFSTFSLNVSDVSFKLAAASLEKGVMPDPATVRSEEFINAFDYRDSEPPPGVPIAFAWERARYPFAQNRDLIRFAIKTAAQGRQAGRPLNLVLLLDNSGSMERADRVQIIHEALRVLAGQLNAQDKLSVIAFARTARLWVDGVQGNQATQVVEQVSNLTPQGGTNLEDAMNLAYQTAQRHYAVGGMNRVVLLTDGAANLGNVDPAVLKAKVEAERKQGIALDCFGIGWEGFNDDLLENLSRNGDGRYGFINTPEEASTSFAGQLAGALQVAASDVKVQVEFNTNRVTAYRQIGYAKHQLTKEQFRDNTVDAAEIGASESGNALYVVEVNPRGDGPLAIVRVRYKIPGTFEFHEQEWPVPFNGNAAPLEQAAPSLRLAATASAFSEWIVSSPYAGEVTPDRLLAYLSGVPDVYGADPRPKKLEWMIRQAKSIAGR